jgi:hypothetical protein
MGRESKQSSFNMAGIYKKEAIEDPEKLLLKVRTHFQKLAHYKKLTGTNKSES